MTEPLEPRTLPKRTGRHGGRCAGVSATSISATRLLAPMTLEGLTALSVETQHEALDAWRWPPRAAPSCPRC